MKVRREVGVRIRKRGRNHIKIGKTGRIEKMIKIVKMGKMIKIGRMGKIQNIPKIEKTERMILRKHVKPVRSLFFDYLIDKSRVNSKKYLNQNCWSKGNVKKKFKNKLRELKRLKKKECKRRRRNDND